MARTFVRVRLTPGVSMWMRKVLTPMVGLRDNPSSWGSLSDGQESDEGGKPMNTAQEQRLVIGV